MWTVWGSWIISALVTSTLCKTGERGFYDFLTLVILMLVIDLKYGGSRDG